MEIREWKTAMNELVKDFQFTNKADDIKRLEELLEEAKKMANWMDSVIRTYQDVFDNSKK